MSGNRDHIVFASLKSRITAGLFDYLLLSFFFFPVTKIVKGVWIMSATDHNWKSGWIVFDPICLIFLIIIFSYFIFMEAFTGYTAGKFLLKIRVVTISGGIPGLRRSLVRNLLRLIDGLPCLNLIGIYLIWKTPEKTRIGDSVAGTRVVQN